MGTSIFIASSKTAENVANMLKEKLKGNAILRKKLSSSGGLRVSTWMDVFTIPSKDFIETVKNQLTTNDYFVTILTPDAEVHRSGSDEVVRKVGSDNVIFEAGAVFGRYGLDRLFFLWDMNTRPPTDLGLPGRLCYKFNHDESPQRLTESIQRIAGKIAKVIAKDSTKTSIDDGRVRFLSLMECRCGKQRKVVEKLLDFQKEAAERWHIRYEQCGVVWGEYDNFLLFSAPDLFAEADFLTALRHRYHQLVLSVDSRLFFPQSYWRRSLPLKDKMTYSLVLLRCEPRHAEDVFKHCIALAESTRLDYNGVVITNIAIMHGSHDVMLMTRSPNEQHHERFVEDVLQPTMTELEWLIRNTTSIRISPGFIPFSSSAATT